MASEDQIIGRESGGNPYIGYGGADLSGAPLDRYGFPIWKGKMGPQGISHAAGLYQFQPGTWATYAGPLGITDFSAASQKRVYDAAHAAEGDRPWAASAPGVFSDETGARVRLLGPRPGEEYKDGALNIGTIQKTPPGLPPIFTPPGQSEPESDGDSGHALLDTLLASARPPDGGQMAVGEQAQPAPALSPPSPTQNLFPIPGGTELKPMQMLDGLLSSFNPVSTAQAAPPQPGSAPATEIRLTPKPIAMAQQPQGPPAAQGSPQAPVIMVPPIPSPIPGASAAPRTATPPRGGGPDSPAAPEAIPESPGSSPAALLDSLLARGDPEAAAAAASSTAMEPAVTGGLPAATGMQPALEHSIGSTPPYQPGMKAGQMMPAGSLDNPALYAFGTSSLGIGGATGARATEAIKNAFSTPEGRAGRAVGRLDKESARANIREQVGLARQAKAQATAALEQFRAQLAPLIPDFQRYVESVHAGTPSPKPALMDLLDHIEGNYELPRGDALLPVANEIRKVYRKTRSAIETEIDDMTSFVEDYYRHMWKETARSGAPPLTGAGKKGSSSSLKERTIPTIGEGIEQGLTPAIMDPIENTLHYVAGMQDFLAFHRARRIGQETGYIKSGPGEGLVPLLGSGAPTYAPKGYATIWNRYYGRGWRGQVGGPVYDYLLRAVNTVTAAKLGLSGYHAWNIAQETAVAGLANAFGKLRDGDIMAAMREAGYSVPVLPKLAENIAKGRRLQQAYLGIGEFGPTFDRELADFYSRGGAGAGANMPAHMRGGLAERADLNKLTDLYARGGGRAVSRGQEYSASALGNYWQSWRRGVLKMEMATGLRGIVEGPIAYTPFRAAAFFAREMSRMMQTVSAPLFDAVIPKVKLAAWADEMEGWMVKHPKATDAEQLAQSRALIDSMDDRFGEMVQDNLFWNPILKQTLNLLATSVGWEYGSLRAFGGAAKDLASGNFSTRARWLFAFPVIMAASSAAYQYLKTGKGVEGGKDILVPRTGGQTPEGASERALLPGYEKDALQWWDALATAGTPMQLLQAAGGIVGGKLNPAGQLVKGLATGKDALGHDIATRQPDPKTGRVPPWYESYAKFVLQGFTPIPFQQPRLRGSAISEGERFGGVRPAPEWLQNPARVEMLKGKHERGQFRQERSRERYQRNREARPSVSGE